MRGIKLKAPYGQMVLNNEKKLIVSNEAIPWEDREMYLIEDHKITGIITLSNTRGPFRAEIIKVTLEEFHKLSEEAWNERAANGIVYTFMIEEIKSLSTPVEYSAEGFWIDDVEVELGVDETAEIAKIFDLEDAVKMLQDLQRGDLETLYLTKKIELIELMKERVRRGIDVNGT